MQFTTQSIGILFVVGGGILTAFHLTDIFGGNIKGKHLPYRIAMALTGGLCMSIGANLIATSLHERVGF